jgi:hypothetical protein
MTTAPETAGAFRVCEREIPAVLSTAHAVAEAARRETLRHFRSNTLQTANKAEPGDVRSFDPVTIADRAAEAAMRAVLAERRPQDAILGEEADDVPGESGLTWVLDPIDGTRGFIAGTPTWGVLIALCDAEGPIYGIIDQPYIGERFEGGLGRARLTGPRVGASRCPSRPRPRWPMRPCSPPSLRLAPKRNGRLRDGARRGSEADPLRYGLLCLRAARGGPCGPGHRGGAACLRHLRPHCRDRGRGRYRHRLVRAARPMAAGACWRRRARRSMPRRWRFWRASRSECAPDPQRGVRRHDGTTPGRSFGTPISSSTTAKSSSLAKGLTMMARPSTQAAAL